MRHLAGIQRRMIDAPDRGRAPVETQAPADTRFWKMEAAGMGRILTSIEYKEDIFYADERAGALVDAGSLRIAAPALGSARRFILRPDMLENDPGLSKKLKGVNITFTPFGSRGGGVRNALLKPRTAGMDGAWKSIEQKETIFYEDERAVVPLETGGAGSLCIAAPALGSARRFILRPDMLENDPGLSKKLKGVNITFTPFGSRGGGVRNAFLKPRTAGMEVD